ncbi:MAG TPA: V-type ATPase 116kDa subunit family protein [Patescibacteria group bacterium]|nr:V-type ATPase 116kDa subunit family protein [Patescibacteria group bacterium]
MAVARMLKASVIGHASVLDRTVALLQRAGVVEIASRDVTSDEVRSLTPDRARVADLETAAAEAVFVRDLLGRFHTPSAPFSSFVSEKVHLSTSEFEALECDAAFVELHRECQSIATRLAGIGRERTRLRGLVDHLAPWVDLHLPISQWQGTEHVALFAGTVPERSAARTRQALRETADLVSVAEVGSARDREAWIVMVHQAAVEDVRAMLLLTEFEGVSFDGLESDPAEERAKALAALVALADDEREISTRATQLAAEHRARVTALVQALLTLKEAKEVCGQFVGSESAFLVTGWVPEHSREQLVAALAPVGADLDLSFEAPGPGDMVPVTLVNPRWLRPFEVLTDLYGRPRYGDIDPTPLLAGFFFLFFGMSIGDVGYGIMLVLAAWFIKHRLDVAAGARRFMDLIALGGLASVIVGVATRSYFALPEESLPAFLRYEPLLDPVGQVMTLLLISVALGVAQVSLGLIVNAYRRVREGDVAGALSVEMSTIAIFVTVGIVVARPETMNWLLPGSLGLAVVLRGRIFEEIFVRRSLKGVLTGVGMGLLGLYKLVSYASDFLSYTRLAALGLVTVLVGYVMNLLAGLVVEIPYGVGFLAAALIFVVGHTFNVVINLLGAFVHSMRLQFVEFFGTFYEGGGRAFAPFGPRTKAVVLHPESGGPEGGVRAWRI